MSQVDETQLRLENEQLRRALIVSEQARQHAEEARQHAEEARRQAEQGRRQAEDDLGQERARAKGLQAAPR